MLGYLRNVVALIACDEHDFPDRKRTSLDTRLAPDWGVAEVDESELRSTQPLFNQPLACLTDGPPVLVRNSPESLAALSGEPHANRQGLGCHRVFITLSLL